MSQEACPMPGCERTLPISPYWNNAMLAQQVRARGWFIWNSRLVCPDHLDDPGPGPAPENVIDFPLARALNGSGVRRR